MNRRTRTLVVVGVAVVLASLASYGVLRALQSIPVREIPIAETHIVVATRDVRMGEMLAADQVRLQAWPADSPVFGAFTSVEEVVGRGAIRPLAENEPITLSKVAMPGSGAGLPPMIPVGMRAQSVRVNDVIGVAGFVLPGSRVDVIVTIRAPNPTSRVAVENLEVASAGTAIDQELAESGQAIPTSVVTLLVTPSQAEKLTLAQSQGEIMLALRNPLDAEEVETKGVRMANLLGEPDPPPVRTRVGGQTRVVTPPPPPAPEPYRVEEIRGGDRKVVPLIIKKGGDRDEEVIK
jgi:pilus assembly protein CpaB